VTERELCKSRPSESISSKRELQNLVSSFGSRCLLRRPGSVLSDTSEVTRKPGRFEREMCRRDVLEC